MPHRIEITETQRYRKLPTLSSGSRCTVHVAYVVLLRVVVDCACLRSVFPKSDCSSLLSATYVQFSGPKQRPSSQDAAHSAAHVSPCTAGVSLFAVVAPHSCAFDVKNACTFSFACRLHWCKDKRVSHPVIATKRRNAQIVSAENSWLGP